MKQKERVNQLQQDREQTLKVVRAYFEEGFRHDAYQEWYKKAREAWRFYDGEQWDFEEKKALEEKGQPAIVINKIASKIDNIAGSEVLGRTRMMLRSRSGDAGEEASARVISDLMLYVAEQSGQALEVSAVFKSGLVSGIGWLDIGAEKEMEGPRIFMRAEDEMQVVFDADARRDDLSDARFVARSRWLDASEIAALFPAEAAKVTQLKHRVGGVSGYRDMLNQSAHVAYVDGGRGLYRVVEVQYKKTEKFYEIIRADGSVIGTFNKKAADGMAKNDGTKVTSVYKPRVYVAYYSGDVLLSHQALPYQFEGFTLVPYVFKRARVSGVPYGMLKAAIDPQRELNKRRSKAMHLLNTAQVIADIDAVDDPNTLATEAARPDGLILKRPGKDLRIIRNTDLAQSQVGVMAEASRDIQDVLGVYDEAIGKDSNATSGIAIQQRQRAGQMNQMVAFDTLRKMKKKVGLMVLALIRQYFTHEMVIQITDQLGGSRVIRLNEVARDKRGNVILDQEGNPMRLHDVRLGVFDVHIEEVRDATSGRELELQQLNMLREAGVPIPPRLLVEATSLRQKEAVLAGLNQGIE